MFLHAFRQRLGEFIMDPHGLQRRAREERARMRTALEGWRVEAEQYWTRTPPGKWTQVPRDTALAADVTADRYGLGLFVLRRAGGDGGREAA